MGQIQIEDMEFFAYHGHFDAEQVIGNKFLVSLTITTDMSKVSKSDELADALDYQKAYLVVKEQMEQTSNMLEHLANRILTALYKNFPNQLNEATISVSKINPSLGGGKVNKVSVCMSR